MPQEGDMVAFDLEDGKGSKKAVNVTGGSGDLVRIFAYVHTCIMDVHM